MSRLLRQAPVVRQTPALKRRCPRKTRVSHPPAQAHGVRPAHRSAPSPAAGAGPSGTPSGRGGTTGNPPRECRSGRLAPGNLRQPGQARVAGGGQRLVDAPQIDARPGNPQREHERQARPPRPLFAQVPDELEAAVAGAMPRSPISSTASAGESSSVAPSGSGRSLRRHAEPLFQQDSRQRGAGRASLRPGPAYGCPRRARGRKASRSAPGRRRRCRRRRRSYSRRARAYSIDGIMATSSRPAAKRVGQPAGVVDDDFQPRGELRPARPPAAWR